MEPVDPFDIDDLVEQFRDDIQDAFDECLDVPPRFEVVLQDEFRRRLDVAVAKHNAEIGALP